MTKFLQISIFILLAFFSINGYSQQWLWSRHFNTAQPSIITGLRLDVTNNVYVTGQFKASINIGGPSNISPIRAGNTDFFLVKYNKSDVHQWHVQLANSTVASKVNSKNVVVDPAGNPIVCGFYDQAITYGVGTSLPIYKPGKPNSFIAKYNASNGLEIWTKRVAWGPDSVKAQWVATDPAGNIYFTGFSKDTVRFTGQTLITSGSKVQNFIAKFDNSGNFLWATQIRSSSTAASLNKFVEIHAASNDEIYLGGFFTDTLRVGSITLKSVSAGKEDAVLIKFDGDGVVQWARQAGSSGPDRCNGIANDIFGNVYTTGYITGSAVFDSTGNGSLNSSPLVSKNGSSDMMVAKYNKNGLLFWKKANGDIGTDIGYGAYIHENIIEFAGSFAGSVSFNNTTITSPSTSNQDPGFFVYDVNGNPITAQKAQGIVGNDNDDRSELITYDDNGNTFIGGYFTSSKLGVGDSTFSNGIPANNNAFIAEYRGAFSATFSTVTNVSCNGGTNGKLIVTPYYGVGPYTYQWSANVIDHNDSVATNLTAGLYSVTVTDSRDSVASTHVTLHQGTSLTVNYIKNDLTCFQSRNGSIDLTVTGGTPGYNYLWTGVSGYNPTTQDQAGLSAGRYKYTIIDKNGCSKNDSIDIAEPDKIMFGNSIVTPPSPSGSANGKIDVNITGGTPAYAYSWKKNGVTMTGRTSDTLNNLRGATYRVAINDSHACLSDTIFVVPDVALLQINKHSTNVTCHGLSDGSGYVSIINKNPIASYTYSWSNASSDSSIQYVSAGKYYITINETGGLGRSISDSIIITEPNSLAILSIIPVDIICNGASTGAVRLSVTGGTQRYNYLWSSGQTTESITSVPSGKYYVTVTDAHLCNVNDSINISQAASMDINFTVLQALRCHGSSNGIVRADVSGGLAPYNYQWNDPGNQTSNIATGLVAGNYQIDVTDANSCFKSDSFDLIQPEVISIASADTHNVSCYNYANGSIRVNVQGGTAPYSYDWSPSFSDTNYITGLGAGITYHLTITDNNLCENSLFSYTVLRPPDTLKLAEKMSSHVDNLCFGESNGIAELQSTGGWGNKEYTINGFDWFSSPVFTQLAANTYISTVRDEGGCYQNDVNIIIKEANKLNVSAPMIIGSSIYVIASGGTGDLHYSLDNSITQLTNQFSDVSGGVHSVRVFDDNNCEFNIDNIIITAVEPVNLLKYNIFPNPSEGQFNLQMIAPISKQFIIQIFTTTGALVYEQTAFQQSSESIVPIDLTSKGQGIYIIEINGIPLHQKLIVQ